MTFSYLSGVGWRVEATGREQKNVGSRLPLLKLRVAALCDVMEQLEDVLVSLRLDGHALLARRGGHANRHAAVMEMFDQSSGARHEIHVRESLLRDFTELGDEVVQGDIELEICNANLARTSLCRTEQLHASLRCQFVAVFFAKLLEHRLVDWFRV